MHPPLRVLVVDDSVVYRRILCDLLAGDPAIEVVGTAANGRIAVQMITRLQPDVLTLDVEMPELDGLGVLRELRRQNLPTGAIMLSALTATGARQTTAALALGGFDFVLKPAHDSPEKNVNDLRQNLLPKLKAFAAARRQENTSPPKLQSIGKPTVRGRSPAGRRPEIIVIGISTGGPAALARILPQLPVDLPVPIVVVQHMPPMFTRSLADDLHKACQLTVREAESGLRVQAGHVYIAPGGKQTKLIGSSVGTLLRVTDDPPEKNCRPSADYLFRSAAETYGSRTLAIIMTGMGDDGCAGCRVLKAQGATILAQDEASCVVYGMPRHIVREGLADEICPLNEIPARIVQLVRQGVSCAAHS